MTAYVVTSALAAVALYRGARWLLRQVVGRVVLSLAFGRLGRLERWWLERDAA